MDATHRMDLVTVAEPEDAAPRAAAIRACFECVQACLTCTDACLSEEDLAGLVRCIRLNLDCADICVATGSMLSRPTLTDPALMLATLDACLEACQACGVECEPHAKHHPHCRACAEACRRCEEACARFRTALEVRV
jgi:Domain of Unknown Function (DUF326)